jgi:hypothetical protein
MRVRNVVASALIALVAGCGGPDAAPPADTSASPPAGAPAGSAAQAAEGLARDQESDRLTMPTAPLRGTSSEGPGAGSRRGPSADLPRAPPRIVAGRRCRPEPRRGGTTAEPGSRPRRSGSRPSPRTDVAPANSHGHPENHQHTSRAPPFRLSLVSSSSLSLLSPFSLPSLSHFSLTSLSLLFLGLFLGLFLLSSSSLPPLFLFSSSCRARRHDRSVPSSAVELAPARPLPAYPRPHRCAVEERVPCSAGRPPPERPRVRHRSAGSPPPPVSTCPRTSCRPRTPTLPPCLTGPAADIPVHEP